jgi:hypothetical protein
LDLHLEFLKEHEGDVSIAPWTFENLTVTAAQQQSSNQYEQYMDFEMIAFNGTSLILFSL